MELAPYVDAIGRELASAAEVGGEDARALAERLAAPLESALRLALLEALSAAASEITRDLAPGSVDLRLRGREATFVVSPPPAERASPEMEPPSAGASEGDEVAMTRINLRLTQDLKDRVEESARQAGLSVNAWLVRAAAAGLEAADHGRRFDRHAPRTGERFTGWVR